MYELKKMERYLRVNLLGPGPRLMKKRIYRAALSQRLRNTTVERLEYKAKYSFCASPPSTFRKSILFPQHAFKPTRPICCFEQAVLISLYSGK